MNLFTNMAKQYRWKVANGKQTADRCQQTSDKCNNKINPQNNFGLHDGRTVGYQLSIKVVSLAMRSIQISSRSLSGASIKIKINMYDFFEILKKNGSIQIFTLMY